MTALFLVVAGTILGQCDKQCYDARHEPCKCPCSGLNHGKGYAVALANTRLMEFGQQHVVFAAEVRQPPLFDLMESA